jgi:Oxidoreductase-like protein, N-terminal
MSGCAICVHDLYQDSLTAYNESLASLRSLLSVMRIPKSDWPPEIQMSTDGGTSDMKNVSLSVFEELERKLRERRVEGVIHADSS